MLGDSEVVQESITSTWRETEVGKGKATQTEASERVGAATQTSSSCSIAVQTEAPDTSTEARDTSDQACATFLRDILPTVEEQLKRNLESHAFDDYTVAWSEDRDTIVKLYSLHHDWIGSLGFLNNDDTTRATACSSASWNANGTILAVAYGASKHEGWCKEQGGCCFWNIMKRSVGESGKADICIEVPCSLMCIQFHPTEPTIIVGGLFNGEIRIWDISNSGEDDDPMLMSSTVDDYFHREPIAQVAWVKDMKTRTYQVVSINGDGKVLFWSMKNKLAYPVAGLAITPSASYFGQGGTMNRHPVLGGTTIGVSPLDYSNFVVGTEGGGILRYNTGKAVQRKGVVKVGDFKWTSEAYAMVEGCDVAFRFEVKKKVETHARQSNAKVINIPVIFGSKVDAVRLFARSTLFAFEPHAGPVYKVVASPFHRNIFLTCSTDGTARLYNMLRPKPLLYFDLSPAYLFDVVWSPARPLVFALACSEGKTHVYDLQESMMLPVLVVPACDDGGPVTSVSFNNKDASLLAAVDETGKINVYQLSPRLSTLQQSEMGILEQMGAAISQ